MIRRSNSEMAFQFVSHVPAAMGLMGLEGTRQWLLNAMDIYDKEGLYPGSAALDNLEQFAAEYRLSHIAVSLDEVRGVLETFICGLAGRTLKLEAGNSIFTDTNTLYLPASINRFNDREKNYQLFKATAVQLWAQTWFGTFRRPAPDAPHLVEQIAAFDDGGRALRLFNILETVRLNACIDRELPGLSREMQGLDPKKSAGHDATWQHFFDLLETPGATVADTIAALEKLYPLQTPWPEPFLYQGGFDLDAAKDGIERRLEDEKTELQKLIAELLNQTDEDGEMAADGELDDMEGGELEIKRDPETGELELSKDGETLDSSQALGGAARITAAGP